MWRLLTQCVSSQQPPAVPLDRFSDDGDVATAFTNDWQKQRDKQTEAIKLMAPEEREVILARMERDKDYITCSPCKRKDHNSNKNRKNEQFGDLSF